MSISHIRIKIKDFMSLIDRRDVLAVFSIILAGLGGYMIGRLDPLKPTPKAVEIRMGDMATTTVSVASKTSVVAPAIVAASTTFSTLKGKYVASKNGTKYYLATCSGAKTISESNKIWFLRQEDAEKAGYSPASTCKGI